MPSREGDDWPHPRPGGDEPRPYGPLGAATRLGCADMANASRLLLNPAAGRGRGTRAVPLLGELAARHGLDLVVTTGLDHLLAEVREAVARGDERLPVAGGDGTFHHVAGGLAGSETALAPLPVGSGNDLTACLGVPQDLGAALEALLDAPARPFDLGHALGRPFILFAGLGIDGEVAHYNNTKVRRLGGTAAYVYSLLRVLPGFRAPELGVTWDRGTFEGPAYLALAANCPRVGGGMRLTPEASWNDGLLDLILVDAVPKTKLLRIFPGVFRGTHVDHPAVHIVRTRTARIRSDRPLWPNADGEPLSADPVTDLYVSIRPGALRVVAGT